MQFDSLAFLAFFLIIAALYWWVPAWHQRKNVLLAASYLFYAGWNPYFLPLLVITSLIDWRLALHMGSIASQQRRKKWLIAICTMNLAVLGYFKYANFFIDNLNAMTASMGLPEFGFQSSVALPIGISFYIFHSLSYCIDVYRGGIRPTASWRDYLLYVAFFPQLVAGPIVRWTTMGEQIETPRPFLTDRFILGVALMVVGLFQKIVLADGIFAPVANAQFDQSTFDVGVSVWMGALAFTGQIFCDFAGYTTCAIGAALVLGFRLPVNFQSPYAAIGFSDFWRRWHISLSSWLRDYLYISLGGNRGTAFTTARNLMITMLLGGLWHGAAWTFVVWGLLHGLFLLLERGVRRLADTRSLGPAGVIKPLGWCMTLIAVVTAWVFFRADDLGSAVAMVTTMFSVSSFALADLANIDFEAWWSAAIFAALLGQQLITRDRPLQAMLKQLPWPLLGGMLGAMLFLISTTTGQSNAFIYFQF